MRGGSAIPRRRWPCGEKDNCACPDCYRDWLLFNQEKSDTGIRNNYKICYYKIITIASYIL